MPESLGARRPLVAAALLAVAVSFAPIASHSLWTPDEPTGAGVGRAMLASGDYVLPRLGGQPFLEKPPLYWWVQVAGYRLFGVHDWTARLPSALFGVAALLVTYALGRRAGGAAAGLAAVGVLATTAEWSEDMGRCVVDPALACFIALAHLGFAGLAAPAAPGADADRRRSALLVAIALPLAFLSKGVVGIGLAAGPPALYLLATGRGRGLRRLAPAITWGVPLFLLLVGPWAWALARDGGAPALRETLVGNTVGRLLSTRAGRIYGHRRPPLYYLENAPAALFPWVLALPALVAAGVARRDVDTGSALAAEVGADAAADAESDPRAREWPETRSGRRADEESAGRSDARRLLFASSWIGALLLSMAASKRALYLLPLLPALAACAGWWLAGRGAPSRWDRPTRTLLLALGALLPWLVWDAAAWARLSPSRALAGLQPLHDALSPARLAIAALFALAVSGAALRELLHARRAGRAPRPAWIVAPYLLVFLAVQTAGKAAVDPVKDLHDLTATIARLAPGRGPVPLYVPPEVPTDSIYGILDFDLGRRPLRLATPGDLAAFLAAHPGARVALSVDSAMRLPPTLRDRLALAYDETGRKASPWAIAEARP